MTSWYSDGMKHRLSLILVLLGTLVLPTCGGSAAPRAVVPAQLPTAPPMQSAPPTYSYEIIARFPHDRAAFTEGLAFVDGALYESTGLEGASSLRREDPATGQVQAQFALAPQYFGEGMTVFDGKLFQLTWQSRTGFVYDPGCFCPQTTFTYDGEGWGLTHDDQLLIMSDGTPRIRFLDPRTFAVVRTVDVTDNGAPVRNLNELEYVRGEIYANVWMTDRIARIDPTTGNVTGWIDLSGLDPDTERLDPDNVLNGIAYDAATDRLFVTGKRWPTLFEIHLKPA